MTIKYIGRQFTTLSSILAEAPLHANSFESAIFAHNKNLRKATPQLKGLEESTISSLIQTKQTQELIAMLIRLRKCQLASPNTLPLCSDFISHEWNQLSALDRSLAVLALSQYGCFDLNQKLQADYGMFPLEDCVTIAQAYSSVVEAYGKVCWSTDQSIIQRISSIETIGDVTDDCLTEVKDFISKDALSIAVAEPPSHRSNLQLEVDCFLSSMGMNFDRQVSIGPYSVDFLVKAPFSVRKSIETQADGLIAIEVNGDHHYTLGGRMKSHSIMRGLVIRKTVPLRFVHIRPYNLTKGHRNKRALLQNLLNAQETDWQPSSVGYDCKWQLDKTYREFQN